MKRKKSSKKEKEDIEKLDRLREAYENGDNPSCEYCRSSTVAYMGFVECEHCGLLLCGFHRNPKSHNCKGIDWDFSKRQDEEARKVQAKIEEEKQTREARRAPFILLGALLGAVILMFLLPPVVGKYFRSCEDSTPANFCSKNKPYICKNGELSYAPVECGCPDNQIMDHGICRNLLGCLDGTPHESCSAEKPFFCFDGNLTPNPSRCGCSENQLLEGEQCRQKINCIDGTEDTNCSKNKPDRCYNGTMFKQASICGCPENELIEGEDCKNPEVIIHNEVNLQRVLNGLQKLALDDQLSNIARRHSEDMSKRNFFDHINPDGQDPTDRASAAGYSCFKDFGDYYTVGVTENIYNLETTQKYTATEIGAKAVSAWMGSPGHRKNILDSTVDREGIGIYISQDGQIFVTQMFC